MSIKQWIRNYIGITELQDTLAESYSDLLSTKRAAFECAKLETDIAIHNRALLDPDYERRYREMLIETAPADRFPDWRDDPNHPLSKRKPR